MSAKIIIIGTYHTLQCGVGDYSDNQRDKYKNLILDLCASHGIKFIAEEMNREGLIFYGSKSTIASRIVRKLNGVRHANIEISKKERIRLGIYDGSLFEYARTRFPKTNSNYRNNENTIKRKEKLIKAISDPIRERCWFLRLLKENTWPVLFICGDNHVENMRVLIQKVNKGAFVRAYHLAEYLD